jgi:hypothetical protein
MAYPVNIVKPSTSFSGDTAIGVSGVLLEMNIRESRSLDTTEQLRDTQSQAVLGSVRCYMRQLST